MARIPVFYSFYFDDDVMRVQQIRQMGTIDGNEPVSKNDWEMLRRTGPRAIENWIDANMKYKRCVIVLIGTNTHTRPWVKHEIKKAWEDDRAMFGIHIHNLRCPNTGVMRKGANPFDQFNFTTRTGMTHVPRVYDPPAGNAYQHIHTNLADWVERAIAEHP